MSQRQVLQRLPSLDNGLRLLILRRERRLLLLLEEHDESVPVAADLVEYFVHFLDVTSVRGCYREHILRQECKVGLLARADLKFLLVFAVFYYDALLFDHIEQVLRIDVLFLALLRS